MTRAAGELRISFGDGRPLREDAAGEMEAGTRGLTWSIGGAGGGIGVVKWEEIRAWSALELVEARRFRTKRRAQLTITAGDEVVISLLTEPELAKSLTALAQDRLPAGTVSRT